MRVIIFFAYIYLANANYYNSDKNKIFEINTLIEKHYTPTWDDLDTRPLPKWYDKAKIGIFIHWGVYCVPGYHSEWFWMNLKDKQPQEVDYMKKNYRPGFTYQEFAPMFKAEFFDPKAWAELFVKAGAKYIVLTSKHHDGFTMFPSNRSFSWNSVDVGPKKDIVGELANAVRSQNLTFGVYHSLYEWFNPIYKEDKETQFSQRNYVQTKLWPDIKQLVTKYKPSIIWADGDWEAPDSYWGSTHLLAWLYNESPVKDKVVVNDRWGKGIPGKHGDFYNYNDRYNPGKLLSHKWENAFTLDKLSWGYRKNMTLNQVLTINELLYQVVSTVSCGGNVLINVGPTQEGTIPLIFQERLLSLGSWLSINGEAIYSTSPWHSQKDGLNDKVWYTCVKATYNPFCTTTLPKATDKVTAVYAIILDWPSNGSVELKDVVELLQSGVYEIKMLGNEEHPLPWKITNGKVQIVLPNKNIVKSEHAWTLKFN